jgi:flavin reductase (DIM6/NTAB) family NADH-FMN oxidoreductase RutF
MSLIDGHAMISMFICPRPVVLVTTMEGQRGNMFPMNLMGQLEGVYFPFALNSERQASQCVKRAGRVALSSIPFEAADAARQLGKHHLMASIDWKDLPFPVKDWKSFGGPVPEFALRVREVEVEAVKELGSHTFFIGRTLLEDHYSNREYFYIVPECIRHGVRADAERGRP